MDQVEQQGDMKEKKDVSRQTLVVLVILAVIVSLLGTFTVLTETGGKNEVVYANAGTQSAQGTVSLKIVDSSAPAGEPTNSATGQVTMLLVANK